MYQVRKHLEEVHMLMSVGTQGCLDNASLWVKLENNLLWVESLVPPKIHMLKL